MMMTTINDAQNVTPNFRDLFPTRNSMNSNPSTHQLRDNVSVEFPVAVWPITRRFFATIWIGYRVIKERIIFKNATRLFRSFTGSANILIKPSYAVPCAITIHPITISDKFFTRKDDIIAFI